MVYLDTGCLLKLYYPEPESGAVVAAVTGELIVFTPLHELEITTAMLLKVFRGEARPEQAVAAARWCVRTWLPGSWWRWRWIGRRHCARRRG